MLFSGGFSSYLISSRFILEVEQAIPFFKVALGTKFGILTQEI